MQTVSFSGHETFPFRYGWLKKGVSRVYQNPDFFSSDRAMVELGVGKNMVSSIRYWCVAADLIKPQKQWDSARLGYAPTAMGENLCLENGFDPFFEDAATLWLIHWQIASNLAHCTSWYWLFNQWHGVEFTKEQMFSEIQKWLEKQNQKPASDKTLSRDIDVCVRTYVHSRHGKGMISEDTFDCPLTELNLISELEDGKTYQFRRGDKPTLPNEIFLYALSEYWQKSGLAATASLEQIVYDPLSPGKIFKLDEETVVRRLEDITTLSGGAFSYDESAGIKQVFRQPEAVEALHWFKSYYQRQL